jgi:dipeptidyl aminopeptidase/acylaminoacyl peptidase
VEAEDLYRLQLINDTQISPDGRHVVFSQGRVERKSEKKYSNLWIVFTEGGPARQLTYGDQMDTHPRWSPDGQRLAFLSNRDDEEQQQIHILSLQGGEARPLTNMKGEFKTFEWSPDGRQLVIQFRKKDAEAVEREENENKKELGVVARHISRTFFKLDGDGYLPQERWHIWTVDPKSGNARQLTDSVVFDETSPVRSPAGEEIAFVSNRSPNPDLDPDAADLFTMPADGGALRKIDTPIGPKDLPSYSPDGRWLAYIGREGLHKFWKNESLWIVPADGSGPARNLTGHHDIHIGNRTIGDITDQPTIPPVWSPDSQRLTFQVTRHGNTALYSIDVEGSDLQAVMDVEGVAVIFTLDRTGRKVASHYANMQDPGQVWLKDLDENELCQLTHANKTLLDEIQLSEIEEFWFKGADGNDLQGWIMKPPDFDATRQYPSILEIHGGPWLQYGNLFMHEFHFLAAHRYVVYFTNPRGGQGYGEAHSRVTDQNWGTADYADVMTWAEFMSINLISTRTGWASLAAVMAIT